MQFDSYANGEVVTLQGIGEVELTPALGPAAEGLAEVTRVSARGDDRYSVSFSDGGHALVDLNGIEVAHSYGGNASKSQLLAAVYAAMGMRARYVNENEADELTLALGDAQHDFEASRNEETLTEFTQAAAAMLEADGSDITVNPEGLFSRISGGRVAKGRAAARAQREAMKARLARAVQVNGPQKAAYALMFSVDQETGEVNGPDEAALERRTAHARTLGGEWLIPEVAIFFDENGESVGPYEVTYDIEQKFDRVRQRVSVGQRFFILRGPPGTGKDTFLRQVAAEEGKPVVEINVGPGFNLEDAIGGDGLQSITYKDPNGNEMRTTVTAEQWGMLARVCQGDGMCIIQEPEGMENEMVRLHSVAGSDVGEPGRRTLLTNSTSGEIIEVHPEFYMAITYNSGEEDVRFKQALHDRAINLDFEYPSVDEESKRYARMASKMMHYAATESAHMRSQLVGMARNADGIPEGMRVDVTAEDVKPVVEAMVKLRNAHNTNPAEFVDSPGSRQGVHIYTDLYLAGWDAYRGSDEQGKKETAILLPDVTNKVLSMLTYLLPGSNHMSAEERGDQIDTVLADVRKDLQAIAEKGCEDRKKLDLRRTPKNGSGNG
jgi:hypothetical protein